MRVLAPTTLLVAAHALVAPLGDDLARPLRAEERLWAAAVAREPRLERPPVDVRTGSLGDTTRPDPPAS